MNKKTRLIILITCIVLFFVITPYIILYSLGYRIDFENQKIIATGGIYVWAEQSGTEVTIDSKITQKTGFFSNSAFVQNLLPKTHSVLVKKDGYFDYKKNILVQEKEVTKLENITLFKNNISFEKLSDNANYFSVSPDGNNLLVATAEAKNLNIEILDINKKTSKAKFTVPFLTISDLKWSDNSQKILIKSGNRYYITDPFTENPKPALLSVLTGSEEINFNPQNYEELFFIKNNALQHFVIPKNITASVIKPEVVLKEILAYKIDNNNIIWLGTDGNLSKSDIFGKNAEQLTTLVAPGQASLLINRNNSYKIFKNWQGIMVLQNLPTQTGGELFLLNEETKILEKFHSQVSDLKPSPDNQNAFYVSGQEIWINHSNYNHTNAKNQNQEKVLLNKFYEKISDCFWLNNNYLIFKASNPSTPFGTPSTSFGAGAQGKGSGQAIKIAEIDNRNNINIVDLPDSFLSADEKPISIKNPQIFFNQQDEKLYILTEGNLIVSEKLLP